MIRAIVTSVIEGVIKRFSATGRADETFIDREYLQHYGFTSRPKAGAELAIIANGNNIIAIASDDRRYRISLENGEVALYDDLGQKAHLKSSGIEVSSPLKITATAPEVTIVASTKVTMTTPLLAVSGTITAGGDITVGGKITATGHIADSGGARSMAGMRTIYNTHTHAHPADGVTIPVPAIGM